MYLQSARSACEVMELSAAYNPDMSMLPARPHGPSDSCVNCIFVAHAVNWRVCGSRQSRRARHNCHGRGHARGTRCGLESKEKLLKANIYLEYHLAGLRPKRENLQFGDQAS